MDKKETIRNAAVTVISKFGFHQATTDMISKEANVAVGTLYNYFKSKDEILSYIFEVEYRKREAFFHETMTKGELTALEKVERILRFHFNEMRANPDVGRILIAEKNRPCGCRGEGTKRFRGLPRLLTEVLQAGVEEGSIRPHDPEIVAPALMGVVEAVITAYVSDPQGNQKRLDDAADQIMVLLRHGIENRRTEG